MLLCTVSQDCLLLCMQLPASFFAYRKQQHRWTCGPVQLWRKAAVDIWDSSLPMICKLDLIVCYFGIRKFATHWVSLGFFCTLVPLSIFTPEVRATGRQRTSADPHCSRRGAGLQIPICWPGLCQEVHGSSCCACQPPSLSCCLLSSPSSQAFGACLPGAASPGCQPVESSQPLMCWLGQQVPTCPVFQPASSPLSEHCCLPLLQVSIPLWALVHLPVVVTVTTAIFTPKGWLHCILYVLFENAMGIVKMGAVIAGEAQRKRRLGAGVPRSWNSGRC